MGDKKRKPELHVPMSEEALRKLGDVAEARQYKSTAAFVRDILAQTIPELAGDFKDVEWGGYRGERD